MEKTLNIDGKDIRFKSTAGTLMRYRMNFGRDLMRCGMAERCIFRMGPICCQVH